MNIDEIKERLNAYFTSDKVEVFDSRGTGDHFSVIVISEKFINVSLVDRHRMIYSIFEDKIVKQHDIEQWKGSSKEVKDFREKTGDEPLWTNSMFSGMPAYLIDVKCDNKLILGIHKIVSLGIPHPINYIFSNLCMDTSFISSGLAR